MPIPMIDDFPRTLIIGTLPYNPNESSRALGTYFSNWPKSKLRMIYSNKNKPCKGQCESFFQLYDGDLLKYRLKMKRDVGIIFDDKDLTDYDNARVSDLNSLERIAKKKTAFRYLLRKKIWNKKQWYTEKLREWISSFKPELIYICFSDDYFILDIGLTIAKEWNIPIVCQISDDYYFYNKQRKQGVLKNYFKNYFKLFESVMDTNGFSIYISQKIADKYNSTFKKQGFPVYLSSPISAKNQPPIKFKFNYCGKTNLGRYKSLGELGDALFSINNNYLLNVYSQDLNKKSIKFLTGKHCVVHEAIPYGSVVKILTSGSFNIIASGFSNDDVKQSQYSLSTKIADVLASKSPIIAIGSKDDGAIDYLQNEKCAYVIDKLPIDLEALNKYISSKEDIQAFIENANKAYESNHSFTKNNEMFIAECLKYKGQHYE